jgi:hypothetical protein
MDPIGLNEKKYVVYFEGKGFYAKNQPHYYWSYTQDLSKAKKYSSLKMASVRAQNALDVREYIFSQREQGNVTCGVEKKMDFRKDPNIKSNWIEEDGTPPVPQIFEITSEGLTNTNPIPMMRIRSKLQREMEKRALPAEFLQSLFMTKG